jgi:hypothetical protein
MFDPDPENVYEEIEDAAGEALGVIEMRLDRGAYDDVEPVEVLGCQWYDLSEYDNVSSNDLGAVLDALRDSDFVEKISSDPGIYVAEVDLLGEIGGEEAERVRVEGKEPAVGD